VTATDAASVADIVTAGGQSMPDLPVVAIESVQIDFSRPHGKRYGALVHAVLSVVDLDSDAKALAELTQVQGRILGATEEEIAAVKDTVMGALARPLMKRAAMASNNGRCRREVAIALKLDDGVMVEGIVDLAFQDSGADGPWTVVDYKTDFELKGKLEEYRHQVGLYALAISRATGLEVRPVLLRI
jgi:ATP-dependent exoDNAse (exonuclease V) beta subunit